MTISYPLALPRVTGFKTHGWRPRAAVAVSESPFTFAQQAQPHQGQAWAIAVTLPPMNRARAEVWIAWRLALNGREGTFLLGDPDGAAPQGSIAAAGIVLDGAHAARAQDLSMAGLAPGATLAAGDYLQLGSGASARLHKWLFDGAADGDGRITGAVWPRLRAAYSDAAAVVTRETVGVFRMSSNTMPWDSDVSAYGMSFEAMEVL
ncbi:hypothetical protein H261_03213 [Paramagnetospirillum caucaseum]|uniref:Uncharacterized protein n=1 Tax=Paramagnetospirillum caucaseum TaxID=1244869 RepID=M2ZAF3_9PROT|nr:hypothetical protein [Paramagnetospirillum caucaseum]EME71385.1 hypothetical protein H261_03213 [Paramagnetospirillum caucaseum]